MARKNGFTLIEMLVAVGILGIICASAATLYSSISGQNRALQSSLEATELRNDLGRILSDPSLCNNAIENKSFSTREGEVTNLQISSAQHGSQPTENVAGGINYGSSPGSSSNPTTPQGLTAGTAYKNLMIQSFDLRGVRLEKDNPTGADVYSGEARLVFGKNGTLVGSKSSKEYSLRVYFQSSNGTTVDPGGCLGIFQGSSSQACQVVGGRWIAESEACDLCTVRGGTFNASSQSCDTCSYVQGQTLQDGSTCNICPGLGDGWARETSSGICRYTASTPPPPVAGTCYGNHQGIGTITMCDQVASEIFSGPTASADCDANFEARTPGPCDMPPYSRACAAVACSPPPVAGAGRWTPIGCCGGGPNAGCAVVHPTCEGSVYACAAYSGLMGTSCSTVGQRISTPGCWPTLQQSMAECRP